MTLDSPTGPTSPSIADPLTCGEDVAGDLRRMVEIAPHLCPGCDDYHIFSLAKRLAGHDIWEVNSRQTLAKRLEPLLAEAAARHPESPDAVVATCANTAVLATVVHATWRIGESLFRRYRYTAVDRCRSPLILCEEYGGRHGLRVKTDAADLLATRKRFPADIIVLHNFLSFISGDQHSGLLRRLASWLKPGGTIVIWNMLAPNDDQEALAARWRRQIADVKAGIEQGTIEITEAKETFLARLDGNVFGTRPSAQGFADAASLTKLLTAAGLAARSVEEISQIRRGRVSRYAMVVAGPPSG